MMQIAVKYYSRTSETAQGYGKFLVENTQATNSQLMIEEQKHQYTEEGKEPHSYFVSDLIFTLADATDAEIYLKQLDNIKLGYVECDDELQNEIFSDIEVFCHNDSGDAATNVIINYLHDKTQGFDTDMNRLREQIEQQGELIRLQSEAIAKLQENYRGLQVYLRTYIDIEEMKRVLISVTEEVDADILDHFKLQVKN